MEKQEKTYELIFLTELLGTVPKDPKIYKTYIESHKPPENKEEDESENVEKIEEKGWTGFMKDEQGYFLYEYMIKGFLKHAGTCMKDSIKIKAIRSKIDNFVFISPRKIYLDRKEVDGFLERPLRAMTMQGPRVSLARSDYFKPGLTISFTVTILKNKEITQILIDQIFEYGEFCGVGQFRNGGYGRFKIS